MDFISFHGVWRMDWGLGNPNKTAALISILMVAVWGFTYIRQLGFWLALATFTGLAACLVHTMSRGGIVATVAGLVPVLYFAPRPWPARRILAIAVSIIVIAVTSVLWRADERYIQGMTSEDGSITHRLDLWKTAPQMMKDAPGGWGLGNSGRAYMQWYEPADRSDGYRTLVSSHLTWLVELGWPMRVLYVFAWLAVLMLCWPVREAPWSSVPVGIWLAFAVAAIFSSVAESPLLWPIPVGAFLFTLYCRVKKSIWPSPGRWLYPAFGTVLVITSLIVTSGDNSPIRYSDEQVRFGIGAPNIVIVADQKVLGTYYGQALRAAFQGSNVTSDTFLIPESLQHVGDVSGKTVVFAGEAAAQNKKEISRILSQAKRVIFISPTEPPQELGIGGKKVPNVEVIFGEFSQSQWIEDWSNCAAIRRIPGTGDYIPNWPEEVIGQDVVAEQRRNTGM